jgi:hypothetical protein
MQNSSGKGHIIWGKTAATDCSVQVASWFLMVTAGYLQEIFWSCWPEITIGKIVDKMDTYLPMETQLKRFDE